MQATRPKKNSSSGSTIPILVPEKVETARQYAHAGEYEQALVQYEGALLLLKGLVNDIPDDAHDIRYVTVTDYLSLYLVIVHYYDGLRK